MTNPLISKYFNNWLIKTNEFVAVQSKCVFCIHAYVFMNEHLGCMQYILHVYVKNRQSKNNRVKPGSLYQLNKSQSRCWVHLYRCKQSSCAQLAVSKLLWDLYCRNALAGNSSLSFILFVCVKFPLWPHPFSHPVPGFVHPSMGTLCQCWLHPGDCNHIRAGPNCHWGAFSPPICISPICWRSPWRAVFSIAQASKKTLMLHLISSDHSWPRMATREEERERGNELRLREAVS